MEEAKTAESKELGSLLLDIGVALLSAGASCSRIRITMRRFAGIYDYTAHISIQPKSVSLTLNDEVDNTCFNGMRSTPAQGVNFKTISGVSRLSWRALEDNLSIKDVKEIFEALLLLPHYPRIIILVFVSLAGAAFCFSFGGTMPELVITFGATFCGLFVRQEAIKKKFNPYICVYVGALVATLFAGAFIKAGLPIDLEHAFATSVLFLIPGVPLINCFTDLIDGNILNGIVRGVNALMFSMAIAFGLLIAMIIFNLN